MPMPTGEKAQLLVGGDAPRPNVLLEESDSDELLLSRSRSQSNSTGLGSSTKSGSDVNSLGNVSQSYHLDVDASGKKPSRSVLGATGPPSMSTIGRKLREFAVESFGGKWTLKRGLNLAKIVTIALMLIFCAWIFSGESEGDHLTRLLACSERAPLTIDAVHSSSPLEFIEVTLRTTRVDEDVEYWLLVELQAFVGSKYTVVDSHNFSVSGDSDTPKYRFEAAETSRLSKIDAWKFLVSTNSDAPLAFGWDQVALPDIARYEVIFAGLILCGVYVLIVFELVHRTLAAMLGAFVALAIVSRIHSRPTLEMVVSWIDFETVGLLFGMMVMVGIFSQTGVFEWFAVKAYKWARGQVWKLVVILMIFTAVVSAFLDNVTTILLLTPVTIRLANVMETPPQQILIALVMFSNIGGTATPVGDPPNIIILNDKSVQKFAPEINFGTFTMHMVPGVFMAALTSYFVIRWLSQSVVKQTDPYMSEKREIEVWKHTLKEMRATTQEEQRVKGQLQEYVDSLEEELREKLSSPDARVINIKDLEEKYPIRNKPLLVNSTLVLTFVILLFFLHNAIHLELSLAWIAIIGAIAHLVVSGIRDIEEVLEKVEFGTLMFFAGLFVLMEALEELGLIDFIGTVTVDIIKSVPSGGDGRLAAAVVIILWVSALVSAFIDNIPYTAAMVPVVVRLGTDPALNLPLSPLIYALAFGTCLGGNGTLIGASANVVAAGISESQGFPISFNNFFRTGFPTMIVSVSTVTVYLLVFHVLIPWR